MGIGIIMVSLVGALSTVPPVDGAAPGQSSSSNKPTESPRSTTAVPNHALSGVVKSVDATRLVIARPGKNPGEMTFVLSPTTEREGAITVGAPVQIRFRTEGRTQVATAIRVTPSKQPGAAKAPSEPAS
jgi:hypothetical protein